MNVGNTRLKQFEDAIEHGSLLVMTDVPRDRVEEIEERVRKHLPDRGDLRDGADHTRFLHDA